MSSSVLIETGPWAGWRTWPHDTFESGVGPFYYRKDEAGRVICRFIAEPRHMNGGGFMHGGCFLTFADYSCFAICEDATNGQPAVVDNSVNPAANATGPAVTAPDADADAAADAPSDTAADETSNAGADQ